MVKTDADPKASAKNTLYYIYLYVNTNLYYYVVSGANEISFVVINHFLI